MKKLDDNSGSTTTTTTTLLRCYRSNITLVFQVIEIGICETRCQSLSTTLTFSERRLKLVVVVCLLPVVDFKVMAFLRSLASFPTFLQRKTVGHYLSRRVRKDDDMPCPVDNPSIGQLSIHVMNNFHCQLPFQGTNKWKRLTFSVRRISSVAIPMIALLVESPFRLCTKWEESREGEKKKVSMDSSQNLKKTALFENEEVYGFVPECEEVVGSSNEIRRSSVV